MYSNDFLRFGTCEAGAGVPFGSFVNAVSMGERMTMQYTVNVVASVVASRQTEPGKNLVSCFRTVA